MATLTVRQQKPNTLASKAEECIAAFQQCLNKAASIHSRELSLVEDQLARFSVWAGNMKVFGSMRQSLDHRLREAQDVRDTFDALLEAIKYRTENCTSSLEALGPEPSDGTLQDVDQIFQHAVSGIADQISLLHKLSNTIRRASKDVQNVEAARAPRICDDEGNDAEDFLRQIFAHYIQDRFPTTSEAIQQRLAGTMVLRRKRILYRRSRYGNNPIRVEKGPAPPVVTVPRAQPTARPRKADALEEAVESRSQTHSVDKSLAQSATTLAAEKFRKASAPSLVSVSKTVALGSHEHLVFPPAPTATIKKKQRQLMEQRKDGLVDMRRRLENQDRVTEPEDRTPSQDWEDALDAVGEVMCPFCFHALPARNVVDEAKWKQHVVGDLDAYVCLSQECESPEDLYSHSSQWLKHMRQHTLRWRCASKAHGDFAVSSKEEYVEHMKSFHRSRLTDAQLRLLADKSSRSVGRVFESCPLCGIEEPGCGMEEHVIGHLRLLAIKSLPAYESEGSEDPENASNVESMTGSRSTLRGFMDADSDAGETSWESPLDSPVGSDTSSRLGDIERAGEFHQQHDAYAFQGDHLTAGPSLSQDVYKEPGQSTLEDFTTGPTSGPGGMYPACAICLAPAAPVDGEMDCDCETEAFKTALRQAEARMMQGVYDDLREWVRKHAQDQVLERYRRATSEITATASEGTRGESEVAGGQGDDSERKVAETKLRINQLWSEAAQTYPETLEYFYSLAEFTLPPDDDPEVRNPPFQVLGPKWKDHFELKEPEATEPPLQNPPPSSSPPWSFSPKSTPAQGGTIATRETTAIEGEPKVDWGRLFAQPASGLDPWRPKPREQLAGSSITNTGNWKESDSASSK